MLSVVGILFLLIVSAICSAIDRKVEKAPQLSVCPKLMQVMQQDIFLQIKATRYYTFCVYNKVGINN